MSVNTMQEIVSERLGDSYYKIAHQSGLTIYVYPKAGYNSNYAIFGTKYGSINTSFSLDGGPAITVPDGIAHYLEHKLFENEDGDAFAKYAKTGANANAYTSFDKTCYLFSCTEKFEESMEILLDFVQSPYFTPETVAKEQGIIGQEIKMYDDSPEWRVMFNLLGAMYHNHPVKIDIAGTVESIAEITDQKLYQCYNTFYNLNNMVLCVCGNTTAEEVLRMADNMLKPCEKHKIENYFTEEPYEVAQTYVEQKFPVSVELFNLGFKERAGESQLTSREIAETEILLSLLASSTSDLYRDLMESNLINSSFGYELFEGPNFNAIIFSGESRAPKETAEKIKAYISKIKEQGIQEEDFEISKKAIYGEAVSSLNSVDTIGNMMVDFHFTNRELFTYIDEIANVTFGDIQNRFTQILDVNNCSLSVIKS